MRTDLSSAEEEDPPVRASSRARAGTARSLGFWGGAAAAVPEPGVPSRRVPRCRCRSRPLPGATLPAPPPGTREPLSSIFCAVSAKLRGSWFFCSTIYRLRQHCEKEKAERRPLPLPASS